MKPRIRHLLDEINRHSVWQVLAFYLGASWAVLEATSLFSERFLLPSWLFDVALVLLALGFVIVAGLTLLGATAEEVEETLEGEAPPPDSSPRAAWGTGGLVLLIAMAVWGLVATTWLVFGGPSEEEIWAREEGLLDLGSLADEGRWEEARLLAERIEGLIVSPTLDSLWSEISDEATIRSDPPGANVFRRPYSDPEHPWDSLGVTPLTLARFPKGPSVLRLELGGHRPLEFAGAEEEWQDTILLAPNDRIPQDYSLIPGPFQPYMGGPEFAFRYVSPNLSLAEPLLLEDFALQKHEVTNIAYKEFVDAGGYQDPAYWHHSFSEGGAEITWEDAIARFVDRTGRPGPSTWEISDYPPGADSLPVGGVSWYEAAAYAEFRGRDLPTVYHWFRASTSWWSAWILPLSNLKGDGPWPVGRGTAASQYGQVDMAGNVREWAFNASGEERFILGGGWQDSPYVFTVANSAPAFDRSAGNGIRLADFGDDTTNLAAARRPIARPLRDFYAESPVSDEFFEAYRRMYAYDPIPLNASVESSDTTAEWIRERIVVDAAYAGERLPLYLYRPHESTGPLQTVIYYPGSGSLWFPSIETYSTAHIDFLVKSGRAVMFPVYQSTFEREDGFVYRRQDPTNTYREHLVQWIKDLRRAIDYVETRPGLDPERVAYFGHSWGGMVGPVALALEPRIRVATFLVGGLSPLPTQPEADPFNFVSRVVTPVLMLNGEYDMVHPVETSARPLFDLLATPPADKRLSVSPVGHLVLYPSMVRETLEWMDRYLGVPGRSP